MSINSQHTSPLSIGEGAGVRPFKVWVRCATFNHAPYIVATMDGFCRQKTDFPFLCVIIDDASTDGEINLNMLQVQGRSDLFLGLEIIKKIIALAPFFIGAFVGIMPMLWANLAVGIVAYFFNSYYSGRLLGYSSWIVAP